MISNLQLASLAAVMGIATFVSAAPLFNVTFDNPGDIVGSAPNTTPPNEGGVSIYPTIVVEQAGTSTAVQTSFTDSLTSNTLGGTGKVAVLTDANTGGATVLLMQGAVSDEVSTGVYTLSFDWIEDTSVTSSSSFNIGMTNQSRGKNLSAIFFDLGEPAGNIRSGNSVNFGATLGTAVRGAVHHLDWVIDLSEANPALFSDVYLDGVFISTQQRDPVGLAHDGASAFGSFSIGHSGASVGRLAFDNIVLQAGEHVVPEPATLSLLSLGALTMLRRRS